MIKHIALFSLKAEAAGKTSAENKQQIIRNVDRLRSEIPVCKRIEASEQLQRDHSAPWAADLVVYVEFPTLDDYDAYFRHPVHQEAAAFAASVSQRVEGITYESAL